MFCSSCEREIVSVSICRIGGTGRTFTTCSKNVNQQRIMDLFRISFAVAQVLIFPKMKVDKNTSEAVVYGKSNASLEKLWPNCGWF